MSKKRKRETADRAVNTAAKPPVCKPYQIASAVATALCAGVALAQSDDTAMPDEIVVTGVKRSIMDSIAAKRFADAVVDAISAEDVGKFPDKNLAEALQRVPGVVINREFGEGERVNIRGTAPNLTRTLLNGHALATADWFILDQLNATRSFNYLMLPSDVIGQVKVYKSPQANLEEGGIGGTVDVITRNPFDLDSFTAAANLQLAHTDLADETDPNVSGLISWTNEQRSFGIMAVARSRVFLVGAPQNASCATCSARRCATVIESDRRTRSPTARRPRTAGSPPILPRASSITGPNSSQWPSASITG